MTAMNPDHSFLPDVFPQEERRGIYRAIYNRRDIRHFLGGSDTGPGACPYHADWDLTLIRSLAVRGRIKDLFELERQAAACHFDEPHRSQYLSLKLEGIMESPVNLCVT